MHDIRDKMGKTQKQKTERTGSSACAACADIGGGAGAGTAPPFPLTRPPFGPFEGEGARGVPAEERGWAPRRMGEATGAVSLRTTGGSSLSFFFPSGMPLAGGRTKFPEPSRPRPALLLRDGMGSEVGGALA